MSDDSLTELQQVAVFSRDADILDTARQCLDSFPSLLPLIERGNIATALAQSDRLQSARILIVDIRGEQDPFVAFTRLVDLCAPLTRIIVVGDINDIRFYRSLRRAGAAEYFLVPLMRELLVQALRETLAGRRDRESQRSGRLVLVLGVRGGTGATTVALRTASLLSDTPPRPVFFLDLDFKSGDAALQLDLKPSASVHEAMTNPEGVDSLFIERTGLRASANLSLMATLDDLADDDRLDQGAVLSLLQGLLRRYRYVVVEAPRWAMSRLPKLAEMAGTVLLISDGRMSSARDLARWRDWFGGPTENRGLIHVLNMAGAPNAFPMEPFAELAGGYPDVVVPYLKEAAAASVTGPRTPSGFAQMDASLAPLVSKLTGNPLAAERRAPSPLQRLLRRA